jgi:hypothetical protein
LLARLPAARLPRGPPSYVDDPRTFRALFHDMGNLVNAEAERCGWEPASDKWAAILFRR